MIVADPACLPVKPVSTVMTVSKETGVVCYVESDDGTWFKARLALPPDFQMPI